MATFRDRAGREWTLDLDVWLVGEIEKKVEGVKFDGLLADRAKGLYELLGDRPKLVRVLWVMVEEQAIRPGITPEQFARSLGGDALEDAATAFIEALADFSPRHPRELLKAMMARGQELSAEEVERAKRKILAQKLPPEPAEESSTPATSAEESSDSTPAPAG